MPGGFGVAHGSAFADAEDDGEVEGVRSVEGFFELAVHTDLDEDDAQAAGLLVEPHGLTGRWSCPVCSVRNRWLLRAWDQCCCRSRRYWSSRRAVRSSSR